MVMSITGSNAVAVTSVMDVFAFTSIRPSIWAFIDVDPDRKGGGQEGGEHCCD